MLHRVRGKVAAAGLGLALLGTGLGFGAAAVTGQFDGRTVADSTDFIPTTAASSTSPAAPTTQTAAPTSTTATAPAGGGAPDGQASTQRQPATVNSVTEQQPAEASVLVTETAPQTTEAYDPTKPWTDPNDAQRTYYPAPDLEVPPMPGPEDNPGS